MRKFLRFLLYCLLTLMVMVALCAALFGYFVYSPAPALPHLSGNLTQGFLMVDGLKRSYRTYVISLYTTHCSRNAASVAAAIRTSCRPSQIVFTPGSPSLLRPMKPPRRATKRSTSFNVGGRATGCFVFVNR